MYPKCQECSYFGGVNRAPTHDHSPWAWLRDLSRPEFVDRLAHYLGEVNALHPFREGNGRTQRAFFAQLSRDAGWRLRWSRLDHQANVDASRASLRGDPDPLRAFARRRFGYYAMPLLWRDRVIGWATCKNGDVTVGYAGSAPASRSYRAALDAEIGRVRRFLVQPAV